MRGETLQFSPELRSIDSDVREVSERLHRLVELAQKAIGVCRAVSGNVHPNVEQVLLGLQGEYERHG